MAKPYYAAPMKNADAAAWFQVSIEKHWGRGNKANYVAAFIPCGFDAYVRLFHPGYTGNREREVS